MPNSDGALNRPPAHLTARVCSEPIPRTFLPRPLSPAQIVTDYVNDIRDNVRRNLIEQFARDNSPEGRPHPNIVIERVFPFTELDASLIQNQDRVVNRENSLLSYDSTLFEQTGRDNTAVEMAHREVTPQQNPIPQGDAGEQRPVADAEMGAAISQMRTQTRSRATAPDAHIALVLDELLENMRSLQDRVSIIELGSYEQANARMQPEARIPSDGLFNVSYGRTRSDVRELPGRAVGYLRIKDARNLIPEVDGNSRQKLQEFLSASTYAMEKINFAERSALLEEILNTKLKGKLLLDFQTRNVQDFTQLKQELETNYLGKKGTSHLQLEFNALKQKPGETAHAYGRRVDTLAMELYESLIEKRPHSSEQKRAILATIQDQALLNFELGLREDIKLIVRSQHYTSLQEAINAASVEERVKGPSLRAYNNTDRNKYDSSNHKSQVHCHKCGKIGHYSKDCRTSRFANRFNLPKADKPVGVNTVERFCTYCKKTGHKREECWALHGKPKREFSNKAKPENRNRQINATKVYRKKSGNKSDDSASSSSSSSEGEERREKKRTPRAIREHRVTQVSKRNREYTGLKMISLPLQEAKNRKVSFLLDSGATLTLIKVGNLKEDTLMKEKRMALTGVTGHTINTLGKIKASIIIGKQKIRHTMYVVKDDFPVEYEGILGIDFLEKHRAKCDHAKNQVRIGEAVIKLHPYKKFTLSPRSETIIQAVTDKNRIGIINAVQTKPGVFIGCCMVKPKNYTCPISMINTTEKAVEITTPLVTVEEQIPRDAVDTLTLQRADGSIKESIAERKERIRKHIRAEHMNEEERKTIENICEEYNDIFHLENDALTHTTTVAHEINTRSDSAPVNVRPYRLPQKHKEEVNRQIDKMMAEEIIRPSTSQWNAPLLVVPKKMDASGKQKVRIVIDFRKLNDLTIGDSFPLPNITDILDQLGNAKYFSTLDLASGYHQIPMGEEDKAKTAFSTPTGHYEFNRMPFGLKNAPATFQRLMNSILSGIQGLKCLVYLDDIVIYGNSLLDHNKRLSEVLQRLRDNNLKLQPDKCKFLRKEVMYLGHIISEDGIRPDPDKLIAVKNFPVPKKVKDIQSFIGLAGYYRKFIEDFSKIAKPLTKLTRKGEKFMWMEEQQNAFQFLKEKLTTAPVLSYPDFTKEFLVTTDASDYAIGAVLSQGLVGQDRPIAYASRILNKAEQNYSTTEKELLAIVWAVKYFRPYLYGTKFTIITDHRPLIWLFNVNDPGSRLIRWRLKLEEYDYTIVHKAGKGNTNADALSRYPISNDPQVNQIKSWEGNSVNKVDETEEAPREYTEEEKKQILYEYHDAPIGGHQGVARTINRIRLLHNWKGITKDVEEHINKCEYCQKNKSSRRTKMPLVITKTAERPFERCALDIVGPLSITTTGNKYLLTFQDDLTKFSKAIPIANQEAHTVAKEFATKIICEYGIPDSVLTDQGTNFVSEMFKNVCKLLKITKIQTTAYHPQTNGALERSHRTLAEYLRHYVNEDQTDWDEWIPYAMFAYNTTPHTATEFTPFELIYGHRAPLPTALNVQPKSYYTYNDYAHELKERLRATHQMAKLHSQEAKQKAKEYADKNINIKSFKKGDKVLLHDEAVRRGRSKKLEPQWIGPYTVIEKHNEENYTIKTGRKLTRVHANRLKHFIDH